MGGKRWTASQQNAIEARGGPLLVSAAAGSGKTAVLVERAVRLICDPVNPAEADALLLVTFSNAAAAEMRQRIAARLSELARQEPQNIRLQRQLALLPGAQISTVHAFCLELIRQNFHNLEISPDFSLADEGELALLKQECARECVEAFYAEGSGGFLELVELLSGGRDDAKLVETLLKVYDFARAHPFSEDWLDEKLAMYNPALPPARTVWGKSILRHAAGCLRFCVDSLRGALAAAEGDERLARAYAPAVSSDLLQARECLRLVEGGDWDGAVRALAGFRFESLGRVSGNDGAKLRVKTARDGAKERIRELGERYLCATGDEFREDIADLRPKIEVLFAVVRDFSRRLAEKKAQKRRLDFSDLEHFALSLLVERTPDGGHAPSPRAREIAERFACVLVDEYQDTNEVQEAIFTSVSRDGNLFMVGDPKQSIYGFRQAMPEIFMEKKERYPRYDGAHYPARIVLDMNFRSRPQVVGAVNYLFGQLMSREVGEIEYGEEERLVCGAEYPECPDRQPELLLLSTKEYAGEKDAVALEAAAVGRRIREMLDGGFPVAEGECVRPAAPRDFCILMRSPRNRAEVYLKELARLGVPAWAEGTGGFLALREVSAAVALLRALDNPLHDIALAAALFAPWEDFSDDDVARIRIHRRSGPLYLALRAAAGEGHEKAAAFLRRFGELRRLAAILPADKLLMRLYEMTGALLAVQAMPAGEGRRANLLLLQEYAGAYHKLGYKQLGGFVGFLSRLEERGGDLAPANTLAEGANVVRILSVHRSKGLEFPVVFLCDTAHGFNKTGLRENTLLHSRYGFACVRRNRETLGQFATVPMQAVRLETERSMLSEELRILYVALTRAREKLVVSAAVKSDLPRYLAKLALASQGEALSSQAVEAGSCYEDWLLLALQRHPSGGALREAAGCEAGSAEDDTAWEIRILTPAGEEEAEAPAELPRAAAPDPALRESLCARREFTYPYLADVRTPGKLAVSAVAKEKQEAAAHRFSARPKFLSGVSLTPAERGSALHKFMQFADYKNAYNDLEGEIVRMREGHFLSAAEAESLSKAKLHKFFHGNLAKRIFASAEVYRELKFMAECGHDMLGNVLPGMSADSKVALQGVADCVFIEDGAAVIVDYKTDRVKTAEELKTRYERQLLLYKAILAETLGRPVGACVLYSFALGRDILL